MGNCKAVERQVRDNLLYLFQHRAGKFTAGTAKDHCGLQSVYIPQQQEIIHGYTVFIPTPSRHRHMDTVYKKLLQQGRAVFRAPHITAEQHLFEVFVIGFHVLSNGIPNDVIHLYRKIGLFAIWQLSAHCGAFGRRYLPDTIGPRPTQGRGVCDIKEIFQPFMSIVPAHHGDSLCTAADKATSPPPFVQRIDGLGAGMLCIDKQLF